MKLMFLMIVVAALVAIPAVVLANGGDRGKAKLKPPTKVSAQIKFEDNGVDTLTITGKAKGMTPGETYTTRIYDIGSVNHGPEACEPTIFSPTDPNFILPTMFVGTWTVDANGKGTLSAVNINGGVAYVPLSKIGTTSVRREQTFPGSVTANVLESCGKVKS